LSPTKKNWWSITSSGAVGIGVILAVLSVLSLLVNGGLKAKIANDQAEIDRMIRDSQEAYSRSIRCMEERAWMLTSPEAQHAEVQRRLAEAGDSAEWVDPGVLERLEAAKRCQDATPGGLIVERRAAAPKN